MRRIKKVISDFTILGPYRTGRAVLNRLRQTYPIFRMARQAPHTWVHIAQIHRFSVDFDLFLQSKSARQASFLPLLFDALEQAELLKKASFLIGRPLGPAYWLNDGPAAARFFGDIQVEVSGLADIKDAWIRGRCHEVPLFAQAYRITGNEAFRDAALGMIDDWIVHNRYLHGVHWVGPMEVAIRAVNWIVGLELLGDVRSLVTERIICSLYDHLTYLENRWEFYDGRTNNHYLADLVGYSYLCWFFYDLPGMEKKWTWCMRELTREWDWQIFSEGTSYEGSTQYHALVMELLFFAKELARDHGTPLDTSYDHKFDRMAKFYARCAVNERGDRIVIGDDGSDSLLPIISRDMMVPMHVLSENAFFCVTYSEFGLTIINQEDFHVSLRHGAYTPRQPSGHFHNDRASITLAYRGVPIIVDPGSYVYTRCPIERNYFRSVAVHNTFFIEGYEPGRLDCGLFVLPIAQHAADSIPHRTVTVAPGLVTLTDWWEFGKAPQGMSCWNFTCAPDIALQRVPGGWMFVHDGVPLLRMESALSFERYEGWVSPAYGVKRQTYSLRARIQCAPNESSIKYQIYFVSVSDPSLL